jgi:hypothetical protein
VGSKEVKRVGSPAAEEPGPAAMDTEQPPETTLGEKEER